ncbi:MAG: type IV pilus assembly protein PilM [Candidatus Gribaldobacteria bacterium]|nr:type IV pilus assembly protein PilM [Candidatus Gribaldobacteria bacterium]
MSALSIFNKTSLGIDIGVSSIKIVEVSISGKKKKLENYLEFQLPQKGNNFKAFHSEDGFLLIEQAATVLKGLLKRFDIKQKRVAFSIPDFSTFFTTFTLPPMSESEVPKAVEFEARHHIPVPISEVNFDWQIIEKDNKLPATKLKVLLVAVPKKVLFSYQSLAEMCGFNVRGLEAEVFGLIRAVVDPAKFSQPTCLVDFGWQSTTISLVKNRNLLASHSFDISGSGLSKELISILKVDFQVAEDLKKQYGLDPQKPEIFKILSAKVNEISTEIEKICQGFQQDQNNKIEDVIISGGTATLLGLKDYLARELKRNVFIADPFESVQAPLILQNRLKQIGPSFSVAVGVSLMGAET